MLSVEKQCKVGINFYNGDIAENREAEKPFTGTNCSLEATKNLIITKNGKLTYDKLLQDEFDILIYLLQKNYPIVSLKFSYSMEHLPVSFQYASGAFNLPRYTGAKYNKEYMDFVHNNMRKIPALSNQNLSKLINILLSNTTVAHFTADSHNIPVELVAKLLITNCNLVELKLSNNQKIDANGICSVSNFELGAIENALLINQSLIKLDLNNNNINDEGANILANVLLTNKTITGLNLEGNHISKGVLESIENRLKRNAQLNNAARWFLLLSEYPDFSNKELEEKSNRWSVYNQWRGTELKPYKECQRELMGELLDKIRTLPRDVQIYLVSFIEGIATDKECIDRTRRITTKGWLEYQKEECSVQILSPKSQQSGALVFSKKASDVVNPKQSTILEESQDSSKVTESKMQMKSN